MDERECIIALNTVLTIGGQRFANLMQRFGSAQAVIGANEQELSQVKGIGKETARRIGSLCDGQAVMREIQKAQELGVEIATQNDPSYPHALLNISYPPPVIYILGRALPSDAFSIAIVGSRKPSYYGTRVARLLSKNAAEEGLAVVSGMARGIDSAAHKGALDGGGRTIAVLGSSIDITYPPENEKLAEEIRENGAVVSEFPFGTCPFPQNFPRRNRIISGLALGLVIVQAGETSGALITADFALEQGREVFAVPGEIGNPLSRGTHNLIKQGARLVEGIDDILEELRIPAARGRNLTDNAGQESLSSREKRVLAQLGFSPMSTDDIVIATGFSAQAVTSALVRLELKGVVARVAGGYLRS
jgi:DNA processing protein